MKIKPTRSCSHFLVRSTQLLMRLFILLCCTTMFSLTPKDLFSQSTKINVDSDKEVTVDEVFDMISQQTKYAFVYRSDMFKDYPKVSLKKGIVRMDKLINQSLGHGHISIVLTQDHTIIIQDARKVVQFTVSGMVTDGKGVPIPGATVLVKGTTRGVSADFDGKYAIEVSHPSQVLVFSSLGYQPQEITVGSSTVVNVQLEESVSELDEVVVNAGYYTVSEKERTGSISRITTAEIEKQPVISPVAAIQGRMPGVFVQQTTGVPGGGFEIQIRGINSLRSEGNEPLYIVDGVPFSSNSLGYNQTSTVIPGISSPLNNLDPSVIASIEVLKDADATAIYGSRGANGVVLITTKKGKSGRTAIRINTYSGIGKMTARLDLMDTEQYLQMRREAYANDGITEYPTNAYDVNGTWDQSRYTDWQEELLGGTSYVNSINGSVSGGGELTNFLFGANHFGETTVFPGKFSYKKTSFHSSVNHHSLNENFRFNLSVSYVLDKNDQPGTDLTRVAKTLAPNAPKLYTEDGGLNWEGGSWNNPLSEMLSEYLATNKNLISSLVLSYQLTPSLNFKSNFGYNDYRLDESKTEPSTKYNPAYGLNSSVSGFYKNTGTRNSWLIEPQMEWHHNLGNLKTQLLVGATFLQQESNQETLYASGFSSNSLIRNPAAANDIFILGNQITQYNYQAIFSRLNFSWKNRYFLNLTGRRDGSSRFGPENRFANFGALGFAWILSNETFLKGSQTLSFVKIRGSYGLTGNDQIGDYQYLDTYTLSSHQYDGTIGLEPSRLFNSNFSWEVNKKLEGAIEVGFFEDRIFLETGYFLNRSSNQLVGVPLPGTTGFNFVQSNLNAKIENKGLELSLTTKNLIGDFRWKTGFNMSFIRNKLKEFPGLEASTFANQYVVGQSLDLNKVYEFSGLDTQTGIYTFTDFNQDGQITSSDDRQALRDFNPEFYGGLNNEMNYRNWELSFFFQFVKQDQWNKNYSLGLPGSLGNKPVAVLDRWQKPGDDKVYQQYTSGANSEISRAFSRYSSSTAAVGDGSYIRLKNIALSYTLTLETLKNLKCRFFIYGQNLLTITKYDGMDPEFGTTGYLPPLKTITTGIEVSF